MVDARSPSGQRPDVAHAALCRILGLFTIALVGSTWTLWLPQEIYPQVPLFRWATSVPLWADGIVLAILVSSLGLTVVARPGSRSSSLAMMIAAISFLVAAILNQHRLQPWAYFFVLAGILLACCQPSQAVRWLRWLVVSVYVYSALSKFDYMFVSTIGQDFLEAGFGLIGVSIENWPNSVRHGVAILMPAGEVAVALLLLLAASRRAGVLAGIGLHVILLAILGPLGLNQKTAVLIWNLCFCFLLVALFWWPDSLVEKANIAPTDARGRSTSLFARAILFLALILPCFEPLGRWDHWLAWGLYSARAARIDLYVSEDVVSHLPPELQAHCSKHLYSGYLHKLAIDRWSLSSLGVPIYPQDRFRVGVCLAVIERYKINDRTVVVRLSSPRRTTGEIQSTRWTGLDEITNSLDRFYFNARPRAGFMGPPLD